MDMLARIIAHKKKEIADIPDISDAELELATHRFIQIFSPDCLSVIAEIKSKSPSEGAIVDDFDPIAIAKAYEQGGADALSVLTDYKFFNGRMSDLQKVREHVDLPILCKDFFIHEKQVRQARLAGADACLLIMAALPDETIMVLKQSIEALGMDALIEVQNKAELNRALTLDPHMMAINNRNLHDFSMNRQNSVELCQSLPSGVCVISASGVFEPEDVWNLPERIDGVLVGTALMRTLDKAAFLKKMKEKS